MIFLTTGVPKSLDALEWGGGAHLKVRFCALWCLQRAIDDAAGASNVPAAILIK